MACLIRTSLSSGFRTDSPVLTLPVPDLPALSLSRRSTLPSSPDNGFFELSISNVFNNTDVWGLFRPVIIFSEHLKAVRFIYFDIGNVLVKKICLAKDSVNHKAHPIRGLIQFLRSPWPCLGEGLDSEGLVPFNVPKGHAEIVPQSELQPERGKMWYLPHTLDTDSCINAIRRFTCRRETVKEIRSDNGTNFVSANRELKQTLKNLNQDKIPATLRQEGIKWTFNPPHGAHHGSV